MYSVTRVHIAAPRYNPIHSGNTHKPDHHAIPKHHVDDDDTTILLSFSTIYFSSIMPFQPDEEAEEDKTFDMVWFGPTCILHWMLTK